MASASSPASSPTSSAPNPSARASRAASYAKRFAAKEACAKALGTGLNRGVFWRDMGVVNLPGGKPTMQLTGGALNRLEASRPPGHAAQIDLSITDDFPLAQAIVIISAVQAELIKEILDRWAGDRFCPAIHQQPELMADNPMPSKPGRRPAKAEPNRANPGANWSRP